MTNVATKQREVFLLVDFIDGVYNAIRNYETFIDLRDNLVSDLETELEERGSELIASLIPKISNCELLSDLDEVLDNLVGERLHYRVNRILIPWINITDLISNTGYDEAIENLADGDSGIKSHLISKKAEILQELEEGLIEFLAKGELNFLLENCLSRREIDEG